MEILKGPDGGEHHAESLGFWTFDFVYRPEFKIAIKRNVWRNGSFFRL